MRFLLTLWLPLLALSIFALFKPLLPNVTAHQWSLIFYALVAVNSGFAALFSKGKLFLATVVVLILAIASPSYSPGILIFASLSFILIYAAPNKRVLSLFQVVYFLVLGALFALLTLPPAVQVFLATTPVIVSISSSLVLSALIFLPFISKEHDFTLFSTLFIIQLIYLYTDSTATHPLISTQNLVIPLVLIFAGVVSSLYNATFLDSLTQIKGRGALDHHLESLTGLYTLAMIDIDLFKKFNDTHGHDAGDLVLQQVARLLNKTPKCTAYRYGGEEFVLVFNSQKKEAVLPLAESLRKSIEKNRVTLKRKVPKKKKSKSPTKPKTVKVTISIGLSDTITAPKKEYSQVLKQADTNLYKAKKLGRNRVVL